MWSIQEQVVAPRIIEAVYFLYLPVDGVVLHSTELMGGIYHTAYEGLSSFISRHEDTPLIPVDIHLAVSLNWVKPDQMSKNMPYLDEKMRAAIALVA